MGTSYFLKTEDDCKHCGRGPEPLHIGKSSGGWCFALATHPGDSINDLEDWIRLWSQPGACIVDDYENRISPKEMESIIRDRSSDQPFDSDGRQTFFSIFYKSEEDFHEKNKSQRGPNNLLRYKVGDFCVKHGEGTWDCMTGYFR